MKKEKIKVYLYTRVSTTMQIDGYSLDVQKRWSISSATSSSIRVAFVKHKKYTVRVFFTETDQVFLTDKFSVIYKTRAKSPANELFALHYHRRILFTDFFHSLIISDQVWTEFVSLADRSLTDRRFRP